MLHTKYIKAQGQVVLDNNIVIDFPNINLCKTCDPLMELSFSKGYSLNKLCRSPPDDAAHQISRLYAKQFQIIFLGFLNMKVRKRAKINLL